MNLLKVLITEGLLAKLEDIVLVIFSPLYFTLSGLRTRFGLVTQIFGVVNV